MSSFPETYNNLKLQNGSFYMAHILFYLFRRIILLKTSDTGLNYCQHDVLSFQRSSNYQAALGTVRLHVQWLIWSDAPLKLR